MLTMNIFGEIAIKFFVGIASSLTFVLLILRMLKPNIKISDKICHGIDDKGNKYYFFKVINMSIHDAYNVEFELQRKTPYIVDKTKVNHRIDVLKLSRDGLYSIPRYKKEKGYGEHAIVVRTFEDIALDINQENLEYVLFVSAKHGLSNLTKVTSENFEDSSVFHKGNFKFGKNLEVC